MTNNHKQTILVCEDDEAITEVVKIVLEDAGYKVKILTETEEIVEFCRKENPSLVLLDIWMPTSDGREVAKALKSNDRTKKTPVLFLSAHSHIVDIAQEAGVDGYIKKPFDIEDLTQTVAKYIQT